MLYGEIAISEPYNNTPCSSSTTLAEKHNNITNQKVTHVSKHLNAKFSAWNDFLPHFITRQSELLLRAVVDNARLHK